MTRLEAGSRNRQLDAALAAIVLVMAAWGGTWFEVKANGVYTEGLDREPTISTQYIIDNEQEAFELTIENATPLLLYWIKREEVEIETQESEEDPLPENSGEKGSENRGTAEEACSGSCLDLAREIISWSMIAYLVGMLYVAARPSLLSKGIAASLWLVGTAVILVAVPLSTATDFGILDSEDDGNEGGGGSATGGFDTTTDDAVSIDQFAHFEDSIDIGIGKRGFEITYKSIGFDLGMLEEDEREVVIESPPVEGDAGYEALIGFTGKLVIGPGSIVSWWFVLLPVMAFAFSRKALVAEEEE